MRVAISRRKIISAIAAVITLVIAAEVITVRSAWAIFAERGAMTQCNCGGALALTFSDWAVLGLVGLYSIGLLFGLYFSIRTLIRTRKFTQALVRSSFLEKGILFFNGGRCEAFTFGFFKPRIAACVHCFRSLPYQEFEAMVSHEHYHVMHKDPFWFFILDTLRYTFFFVPLLRSLVSAYRTAAELAADGNVTNREALGGALLRITGEVSHKMPGVALSQFASALGIRIERLINPNSSLAIRIGGGEILVSFLIFAGALGIMSSSPSSSTSISTGCSSIPVSCVKAPFDQGGAVQYTSQYSPNL